MFKVTVALVFACFVGIHSMPRATQSTCYGLSCHNLVSTIEDHMKDIQLTKGTHATNVTDCKLINCNLNIFKKELNKRWRCENTRNDSNECLFYKMLECIPYSCKVLNTTCQEPDRHSDKHNLNTTMIKFLGVVSRELKSRDDEGNSCEKDLA